MMKVTLNCSPKATTLGASTRIAFWADIPSVAASDSTARAVMYIILFIFCLPILVFLSGFEDCGLFLVDLVLGFLFPSLYRFQHLLGLLRGNL